MTTGSHIKNSEFISSRDAALFFGYTPDYVSRLARQGKINAERLGHQWFVDLPSLKKFVEQSSSTHRERMHDLSLVRKIARKQPFGNRAVSSAVVKVSNKYSEEISALLQAGAVVFSGFLLAVFFSVPSEHLMRTTTELTSVVFQNLKYTAYGTYKTFGSTKEIQTTASVIEAVPVTSIPKAEAESEEGVVIFSPGVDEEALRQAQGSFSDPVDVVVDPIDRNVGIITPRFETGGSDKYRFLIVPVDSP